MFNPLQDIEMVAPMGNAQQSIATNTGNNYSKKTTANIFIRFFVLVVILTATGFAYFRSILPTKPLMAESITGAPDQMFDHLGRYIMHNFDQKKPMANFLSGLSGFWGVPMVRICVFRIT